MPILWAVGTAIAGSSQAGQITDRVQGELTQSFASAQAVANQYPQYANGMIAGAKSSLLSGADAAYTARIIAIVAGAVLVALLFPRRDEEQRLLAAYHAKDSVAPPAGPTEQSPSEERSGPLRA